MLPMRRGQRARLPGRTLTVLVAGAAAVAAAAVVAVGLLNLRTDTSPAPFLPADDPTLAAMDRAATQFGGDSVVVLVESSEPGALLAGDQLPKLVGLEGRLSGLPDVAAVYGPATTLNQIATSSQNMLAQISGQRDTLKATAENHARTQGASPSQARTAAARSVAEFDLRYGSLLARGLPAGLPTLHNPRFVDTVVFDQSGTAKPQWRFLVPTPNSVAIMVRPRAALDQTGTDNLVRAVHDTVAGTGLKTSDVTVSGAPAVAAGLSAQTRHEVPVLGALAVALIALCYLLIPWRRRRRERLLPLTATLCATGLVLAAFGWFDIPLSIGVIAFLPILVGIGSDFPAYLVQGANPHRVLVAAAASAAGFASLAVSPLPFVRELGLTLAAGVLVAVGAAMLLGRLVVGSSRPPPPTPDPSTARPAAGSGPAPISIDWRQRWGVLAVVGAVAAGGWLVLPTFDVEARPDVLAEGLPAVAEARHVEDVLGTSGEVQVLLRGPNVLQPEALAWMRRAQDDAVVQHGGQMRPIVSLPDLLGFLGPSPTPEQIAAGMRALPPYLTGAVVDTDGRTAILRLGIRLQDLGEQQRLLAELESVLGPPPPGYQVEIAGLPVAAAHGNELVSAGRYLSNGLGILLAGLVLLIGLAGRRSDALRAVLAAVIATGWGLAGAWLLSVPLTPLTVALGSLSTATACEFTIVLAGGAASAAPQQTRRTVGVAALAACLGYAALAGSGLAAIRDFGLLLAATVGLSLLAAHLVVRVFPVRPRPVTEPAPHDGPDTPRMAEVPT